MRQVTDIKRTKKTFNISVEELRQGDWIKYIPDVDMVELHYKNGWLTINSADIKKLVKLKKSEKEEIENGTKTKKPGN